MRSTAFPMCTTAAAFLLAQAAEADITFGLGVPYATPTNPDGIASGDFDRDGDIDLAVATDAPDKVSILLNNGSGVFAAPTNILTGAGTGPNFVRAVDIDGDTDADLIVTLHNANQPLILRNNGSGVFAAAGTIPVGLNPRWIAATRLDANSTIDLLVANRDANTITVLLNNVNLTFNSATRTVGADPRAITVADLHHDGLLTVLVTSHGDRLINTFRNNGAGVLTAGPSIPMDPNLRPVGIVAADLDGDADPDIAVALSGNGLNFAGVLLNTAGVLAAPVNYPTTGVNPGHIAASDADRDGDIDLITVNEDSGNIATLNNSSTGAFAPAILFTVGTNPQALTIADFDRDTMPDIAVTNGGSDSTTVLINAGTPPGAGCYANCDNSSTPPILNVNDFVCFLNHFATGDSYANCNASASPPVLNVLDFNCFLNAFAAGCS